MLKSFLATRAKLVTWLFDSGIESPLSIISNIDLKNCVVSLLVLVVGLCLLMKINFVLPICVTLGLCRMSKSIKKVKDRSVWILSCVTAWARSVCKNEGRSSQREEDDEDILLRLLLVLEGSDGIKNLLGGLLQADGPHLPGSGGGVDGGGEGVDLGHGEPGQRGEDEVKQVLANVDHDVVVLEDALLDGLAERKASSSSLSKEFYTIMIWATVHKLFQNCCLVIIRSTHTCFFMYSRESLKSELCLLTVISGGRKTSWDDVYCHSPGYLAGKVFFYFIFFILFLSQGGQRRAGGAAGVRQQGGGAGLQDQPRHQVQRREAVSRVFVVICLEQSLAMRKVQSDSWWVTGGEVIASTHYYFPAAWAWIFKINY